ncbi:MAG: MgtC/SapB family protein [Clostridia bacterium]|nr:MgtC/SapB family protein [Clostridia bacterium]
MLTLRTLTYSSMALRILLAILLGGVIGMERGMKNRPAGLRTYMLVCLGACIVMLTNQYVYQAYGVGDPVRMGAQVISGIGFLGAGTIIVTSRNQIKGLTTAAGLWASACVGLSLGIGLYEVAICGSLGIFAILMLLGELDIRLHKNTKQIDAYVELHPDTSIRAFLDFVRGHDLTPSNLLPQADSAGSAGMTAFTVTLKSPRRRPHEEAMLLLRTMEGIAYIEEL